jgi:hypothetical protein
MEAFETAEGKLIPTDVLLGLMRSIGYAFIGYHNCLRHTSPTVYSQAYGLLENFGAASIAIWVLQDNGSFSLGEECPVSRMIRAITKSPTIIVPKPTRSSAPSQKKKEAFGRGFSATIMTPPNSRQEKERRRASITLPL